MKRLVIMVVILIGLFALASNVSAAVTNSQDCTLCHGSIANDFSLPNVPSVDRTKCYQCHNKGLHTTSYNGTNILRIPFIDPATGTQKNATFLQDPNKVDTVNLHVYHSTPDPRAAACSECHISITCTSCHQTIPHDNHGSTKYPKASVWMTSGVFGTAGYFENSCTTSNCHGTFTQSYQPVVNQKDGQQLCVNCHPGNIGQSQGTARDFSGHNSVMLETSHGTLLPNQLILGGDTKTVDCSGCHASALTTEHSKRGFDCSTCHNASNPGVVSVVTTAGKVPDNRACGKCHFNSLVLGTPAEHNIYHVTNQESDNLKVDGAPHANCNTCHQRTELLPTISSLANSAVKNYSCLTCHNGAPNPKAPVHKAGYNGQVQDLANFHPNCSTCHDPNATYAKDPARKPVDDVNTIIATKNGQYSCTDCHNNLSAGHQAQFYGIVMTTTDYHLDCATCHSSSDPFVKAAVTTLKGTSGYSCQACHSAARTAAEPPYNPLHSANGDEITGYHAASCNACHGVVNGAYKRNLTGIKSKVLKGGYACTDCHGKAGTPMGKHAGLTSGTAEPIDISARYHQSCATCHNNAQVAGTVTDLWASGAASYLCTECHSAANGLAPGHQAELSVDPAVNGAVNEITQFHVDGSGAVSCEKCHGNNTAIPAAKINTLKAQAGYKCADCHNAALMPGHKAALASGGTPESTLGYHKDCLVCHSNGAVKSKISSGVFKNGYLCTSCHDGSTAPQPNHMAKIDANAAAENISTAYHTACSKCHGNPNYPEVSNIIKQTAANKETDYACSKCHNATLNLEPKHQADWTVIGGAVTGFEITQFHKDCAQCHQSSKQAVKNQIGIINDSLQANATAKYNCSDCHSGSAAAQAKHLAGLVAGGEAYESTAFHAKLSANTQDSCFVCHNSSAVAADMTAILGKAQAGQGYLCTDCHKNSAAAPYVPNHSAVLDAETFDTLTLHPACSTCHTTAADTTIRSLKGKSGYACNSCHGDVQGKHVSTTAMTGGMVNCSWCHSSELTDTHINPAVQLTKQMQCTTCHGAASPVKNQVKLGLKGCADCHDGKTLDPIHPGSQYIPKHLSVFPAIIPEYSPTCVNCHYNGALGSTPTLDYLHSKNLVGCTDCHDNTLFKPAVTAMKTDCTGCHDKSVKPTMDMTAVHDNFHTVNVAVNQESAQCLNCHKADGVVGRANTNYSSVNNLLAVHQKKPAYTKVANCDACHGTSARPEVKQAIAANNTNCTACHPSADHKHTVVSYEAGTDASCVQCHSTGTDPANAAVKTTELSALHSKYGKTCAACHTAPFLGTVIAGDGTIDMMKSGSTPIYCSTCHNGTLAPLRETGHQAEHKAQHSAANMDCTNCHGFTLPAVTPADISSPAIHKNGCDTCHSSTTRDDVKLIIAAKMGQTNPVYTCEECHGGALHVGFESKHQPAFPANQPAGDCSGCHSNNLSTEHEKALTPSTNTAIGYKVFRSADNVNWTEIGSTTATSFANTGLAANTTYYYKVRAYDGKPNYSGFSNVVTVKTLVNTPVVATVNPDSARYVNNNSNGDSAADPSSTTDVLASLTDTSNSSYSDVRESGSQDRYIFVQLDKDAKDYTKVELKMSVRYNNSTNLIVYPYQSNQTNINTGAGVKGTSRSSSSNYIIETIDVTKAAQAMNGYGWMKFRIKPDPARSNTSVYIAKVELVLSQTPVSGGTAANPPGTLTPNSGDPTAPSAPSGLAGSTNYYDRIDLTWTAATDTGAVTGSSCAVCHSLTTRQQAKDAIAAKKANCSDCHTIHADINAAHTGPALATTPTNCTGCHSNVLSVEHSTNARLAQNSTLNCDTCHKSTQAKVKAAISSALTDGSNLKCVTCHTGTADGVPAPHNDLAAPHLSGIFPTATDATCLLCHTTQAAEFVASKGAYHSVNGLLSKANTAFGSYLSPWTATTSVGCKGCHGNNNDGKAQVANILKRPYTYTSNSSQADMLCFLCHDRNTYGGGGSSSGRSGFGGYHNIGDHKSGRLQCSWCHAAVPHSTSQAHLIVTKTDPNSTGNVLDKFTHPASGQYKVSSCTSNASGCGEH